MQSTRISLWTQKYNKSKEPCISLTCRAAWLNMTFCTSALCPAKFPRHGTTSQKTALTPASSAHSSWALAVQDKAGADQQNCLWESCGSQLPFKGWLPNMQAREDRARLFSEVLSDQRGGNEHKLQHKKFWSSMGKYPFTVRMAKDWTTSSGLVDPPPLKIFEPKLGVALRQPDLTGHDLSRGWSGQPPGVASSLHYSIVLWPGDKLLFRRALADQYDPTCLRQKFPAWIWWCLNIRWSSWGFWGENSALRQM